MIKSYDVSLCIFMFYKNYCNSFSYKTITDNVTPSDCKGFIIDNITF